MTNKRSLEENESSSVKKALVALKATKDKLNSIEQQLHEPIAVVGIGCRFPGGVHTPEDYWKLILNKENAIVEIPSDRWKIDAFYDQAKPSGSGKMYTRYGGFINNPDLFDSPFFSISPREANALDPQQRLLLEVTWEALEHGGITHESLRNRRVGVYIGIGQNDYGRIQSVNQSDSVLDTYFGTGNGLCFASGRLSFFLGSNGPNMSIDTACSSSLVALHLACDALRLKQIELGIIGGVQLMLSPDPYIYLCKLQALSPGRCCRVFDANADGFVRGEGAGIVILKRLSDAVSSGNNILAVIQGSAINHGGASSGLTVPNGSAQEMLMTVACATAGISSDSVGFIEAHGTGTLLGDPIEMEAIGRALCRNRHSSNMLYVCSCKANIGHLEAGAGVAGFIKAVLAVQKGVIPPNANFETPNPKINWGQYALTVPTSALPWPNNSRRIAGVSSFGLSGTNSHVILEAFNSETIPAGSDRPIHLLTLSAKSLKALSENVGNLCEFLDKHQSLSPSDLCRTLNNGRDHFDFRFGIPIDSIQEAIESLSKLKERKIDEISGSHNQESISTKRNIVFLYTGQGSQYLSMGKHLYEGIASFREAVHKCDKTIRQLGGIAPSEIIYSVNNADSNLINMTQYTQPCLFTLQYALTCLMAEWGVRPFAVIGHSIGEFAAACAAGILSVEDSLQIVYHRARLMQSLPMDGKMLAIMQSEDYVNRTIKSNRIKISIAAINGPSSVVISGARGEVDRFCEILLREKVKMSNLNVSHAFHSDQIEPILPEFGRLIQNVVHNRSQLSFISTVTGNLVNETLDPRYWIDHARGTVNFAKGIKTVHSLGCNVFLEIGPKPVLSKMVRMMISDSACVYAGSLIDGDKGWRSTMNSLATLYAGNVDFNWSSLNKNIGSKCITLPSYAFQRKRHWFEHCSQGRKPSVIPGIDSDLLKTVFNSDRTGLTSKLKSRLGHEVDTATIAQIANILCNEVSPAGMFETAVSSYVVGWTPLNNVSIDRQQKGKDSLWILFLPSGKIGIQIEEEFKRRGYECITIQAGTTYSRISETQWRLRPDNYDDYKQFFEVIVNSQKCNKVEIVHGWSLLCPSIAQITHSSLLEAQNQYIYSLVLLARTARASLPKIDMGLRIFTQGAMQIDGDTQPSLLQACSWGVAKSISLEFGEEWKCIVDIPANLSDADVESAIDSIIADNGSDDLLAVRNAKRYGLRLRECKVSSRRTQPIAEYATYIVTGGCGGIGLHVAEWMAEQGAKFIVLVSRNGIQDARAKNAIESLQKRGLSVIVHKADVADFEAIKGVFAMIQANDFPPVRGIMHAAGLPAFRLIPELDQEEFQKICMAKVLGTWNLHVLTKEMEMDFFVCFSSISSVWGSKGQAHYGAANHFLDALCLYRRSVKLPGLSINWGPWTEGGMTNAETHSILQKMGVGPIAAKEGCEALGQHMMDDRFGQVVVANMDWTKFFEIFEARKQKGLLDELRIFARNEGCLTLEVAEQKAELQTELMKKLRSVGSREGKKVLMDAIQTLICSVLGFSIAEIDISRGFFEAGMDSMMALELKEKLSQEIGFNIPTTAIFEYPSIPKLTNYIAEEFLGWRDLEASHSGSEMPCKTTGLNTESESCVIDELGEIEGDLEDEEIVNELDEIERLIGGNK
jgi:acyl transferase domain-containing protein/acyl carrier protein